LIRFGLFEADIRAGELRRKGVKVRLQDLPFRALTLLLSRPGEVLARDEFREALWPPDVFVDFDQGISSAIKRLRDALADSADNPIFIETIERRGYRWIGPVQIAEPTVEQPAETQTAPVETAPGSGTRLWRLAVIAVPAVVLLFAVLIFRGGSHGAHAGTNVPAAVTPHHAANREAEDFYLKGRFYWNKRTPESLAQAVDAFMQAIVHDPNYADAYVGLSDSYNLLREFSAMPANEAYSRAYAAAKTAVQLDGQSSEAHASLAFVTYWGMWDTVNAEKEFRRALELDPNNAKAHHWYATFLDSNRRNEEALAQIEMARKLDPNSSSILADKAEILRDEGRREEAVQLLKQLEATDPEFASPHRYLAMVYIDSRDYPDYIAEARKDAMLTHEAASLADVDAAAKGFERDGERGLLEGQLAVRIKLYEEGRISPFTAATSAARLGNQREALKYLNICVKSRDQFAVLIGGDPTFAGLHGDPEFQQLVAQVKPLTVH
jgi:DNA-binding winged helix-turn-helix (wHTH) protein/Tfp pilus assembly protein PilF